MSLVIYRGPSRYDPTRTIRAVLTADSANAKTGNMAQLYILDETTAPNVAQRTGADHSVCGACPLRPANGGGCYVVTHQAPLSTWRSTKGLPVAGAAVIAAAVRKAGSVRLGAYGDPAALPPYVVAHLIKLAHGKVTGYTHGHLLLGFEGVAHLRSACMMSCETEDQARTAHLAGWRTFRVTRIGTPNLPNEIVCPAETRGAQCRDCLLCRGDSLGARSITIPAHGFARNSALRVVS